MTIIGGKRPESTHPNSASYSFPKDVRDKFYRAADTCKQLREKYIPKENPGPSQYLSESLVLKPKSPAMKMTRAKRFGLPGQFLYYESSA